MDKRKNKIVAILILSLAIFIYYLRYLDEVNNLNGSYICVLTIILPVFTWPIFLFRQYLLPYKVEGILVSSVLYFLTPEGYMMNSIIIIMNFSSVCQNLIMKNQNLGVQREYITSLTEQVSFQIL